MKQIIAITNNYELGAGNADIIDNMLGKAHVRLLGVHSDICALQRNAKFRKYYFDCEGQPLTWKLPTKAAFVDYHDNEELA